MLEPLDGSLFGDDQPCFGCAPHHPAGFRLRFEREDEGVRTRMTPDDRYQGPPGIMHGGLVMALADEVAAWTILGTRGTFGFTVSVECQLKRPVRVGTEVEARGRVSQDGRRIVTVLVEIAQSGAIAAEATIKFALLDEKAAENLLGRPLPESWRRFARDRSLSR